MARRGQMEILGIAVIFVLLILGFLFLLRFSTPGEAAKLKEKLSRAQLANNVLSAMLKTNDLACDLVKKPRLEELLIDCAENFDKANFERSGTILCEHSLSRQKFSCGYARDVLKDAIFKNTLDKWKLGYNFTARIVTGDTILSMGSPTRGSFAGCPSTVEVDSQTYLLPITAGMLELTLRVCQ